MGANPKSQILMNKFFKKRISIIFYILIPIIFLWHPNWLGFSGIQPYWPLFWLLPWSMTNGSINGIVFGLFLGLILDSVTLDNNFFLYVPSFHNILAEVFLTGLFAPLICSQLLRLLKSFRAKSKTINLFKR